MCHGSVPDVRSDAVKTDTANSGEDVNGKNAFWGRLFPGRTAESFPDTPQVFQFTIDYDGYTVSTWSGIQVEDELYVEVTEETFAAGTKEGLVELLDYAEETLKIRTVIICIPKETKSKASLMRSFMFLGFQVVNPCCMQNRTKDPVFIFMGYNFD